MVEIRFFLLAFHEIRQKGPIFQRGIQQQLPQKVQHWEKHPVSGQGKAVVHKAAVHSGGLVISHPAHQRADGGPVQFIQPLGHGPQVRTIPGAPEQDSGQKGIFCRFLFAHGPHQLEAETTLLESGIPDVTQGHAGSDGCGFYHNRLLNNCNSQMNWHSKAFPFGEGGTANP